MFSNLSIIVQTLQSKNLDHRNFTLKGKKLFFLAKLCLPLMPRVSLLWRMSKMDGFSKLCGHLTNFLYGFPETRGGTTSPLAQITTLSPYRFPLTILRLPLINVDNCFVISQIQLGAGFVGAIYRFCYIFSCFPFLPVCLMELVCALYRMNHSGVYMRTLQDKP